MPIFNGVPGAEAFQCQELRHPGIFKGEFPEFQRPELPGAQAFQMSEVPGAQRCQVLDVVWFLRVETKGYHETPPVVSQII